MIKVTVWNEFVGQMENEAVVKVYPTGLHNCIADFLGKNEDIEVRTAVLDEPEHGLSEAVLANTDVLIWWAHVAHDKVSDEVAERVRQHVLKGMGLIVLHSGHLAKPFLKLIGTSGSLKWRDGDFERLWNVAPNHPITKGIGEFFELEEEEMYGERFDIPTPDDLVFIGWFSGGEVFRSGCCWNRGYGKVFYFQPGHETCPTYHVPEIQTVITNAVRWGYNENKIEKIECPHIVVSLEEKRKSNA